MPRPAKKRATKKLAARRARRAPKTLNDLFLETLKDIYFAENKIVKTLPKMAKAAHSKKLAAAFNKHLRETRGQIKRLDQVFKMLGKSARGKPCSSNQAVKSDSVPINSMGAPSYQCSVFTNSTKSGCPSAFGPVSSVTTRILLTGYSRRARLRKHP